MAENEKNAALQRAWRKTARGRAYMRKYNKDTVDERVDRNEAHRKAVKKYGKAAMAGKSVHHEDGETSHNGDKNLKVTKRYHGRRAGVKNSK
jgi:hypothetical protein